MWLRKWCWKSFLLFLHIHVVWREEHSTCMKVTHREHTVCSGDWIHVKRVGGKVSLPTLPFWQPLRKLFWEGWYWRKARERTPRQRQVLQRPLSQSNTQSAKFLKDRQLGWPSGISMLLGSTVRNAQHLWTMIQSKKLCEKQKLDRPFGEQGEDNGICSKRHVYF